jgi:hypothetical protein
LIVHLQGTKPVKQWQRCGAIAWVLRPEPKQLRIVRWHMQTDNKEPVLPSSMATSAAKLRKNALMGGLSRRQIISIFIMINVVVWAVLAAIIIS